MDAQQIRNLADEAAELAAFWQERANTLLSKREKKLQNQMRRLLSHPSDKILLTHLLDVCLRAKSPRRAASQIHALMGRGEIPSFFPALDKLLVKLFLVAGRHLPALTIPSVIANMRRKVAHIIIPGEARALGNYLKQKKAQELRININHLGEAVLGEKEAQARLKAYLKDLQNPAVESVSVKISTLYSQIEPLAFDQMVEILAERLHRLYRVAATHFFTHADGRQVPKQVNLDMEAYPDVALTAAAFQAALERHDVKHYRAGMVLQTYLPESHVLQQQITRWARQRVAAGGSPIMLRIVKGANLEMEKIEAELHNWPQAPYDHKQDVDANYKKMVLYAMQPGHIRAVHLGVASHNLFDLAFAYVVGGHYQVRDFFHFEMLAGMADHVCRVLRQDMGDMLLYAPVAAKSDFINAIAYLVRRLDENTAADNFLRHAPRLAPDSNTWDRLRQQFLAACEHIPKLDTRPRRNQNRDRETFCPPEEVVVENQFDNQADTDWSLAANRRWAEAIRRKWMWPAGQDPEIIPLVVAGETVNQERSWHESFDTSRYVKKICVVRAALATGDDIERAVATARRDPDGWRAMAVHERRAVLARVARELGRARGDLIGAAAAGTGKIFAEADREVSEAIDFAHYYPLAANELSSHANLQVGARGVGCVVAPWNFPIAIPCGGIMATLAAGNTVIFKPSSDAIGVAWELCRCFWRAGISLNTLQFLPCPGDLAGRHLISHADVDFVILTGSTATGLAMLKSRPGLYLSAETGGKNATIVTAMADGEQAVKNVIYSAFGHGGQKCSATSLLILEKEVYHDPAFRRQLVDAAASLGVGSVWDFANKMGPLIRPPQDVLLRGLTRLEPGETWALKPENVGGNPYLWRPGIKWGVRPGSFTHMIELFGPVLGVMPAEDLRAAIVLVNQTGYGLTSGLESLDEDEQAFWREKVRAGNLYINRGTTGAMVLRQPFGGMGKSALGPAVKAGSPDYVTQFMNFKETGLPAVGALDHNHGLVFWARDLKRKLSSGRFADLSGDLHKTIGAIKSYLYQYQRFFSVPRDYFHLRGQDNLIRYQPVGTVAVRLHEDDTLFEVLARIAAVRVTGCRLVLSTPPEMQNKVSAFLETREGRRFTGGDIVKRENDAELIASMPRLSRIRYAVPSRVPAELLVAAAKTGFYIARSPVLMDGRLELRHYLHQISICNTYHRYGNIGRRAINLAALS